MKIAYFDGACEPKNPGGVASYGWFVEDEHGRVIATDYGIAHDGGELATNNVAEYVALGWALRWLSENAKGETICIRGDSQLVVRQVNGEWKCNKPHLEKLRDRCRELIEAIGGVKLEWIPREENESADQLSRAAYEKHTGKPFPQRRK